MLRELFSSGGDLTAVNQQAMIRWGIWALGLAVGGFALYFSALMCTHAASFQMTYTTKYRLARHAVALPLGFHPEDPSGKLSKIIDGNVAELENYQESLEIMNNTAVEYVRGISAVKVFNQTVYSFENFYKSVIRYRDYVVKYGMSMYRTMVWFITAINTAVFFLLPSGIVLSRLSASSEWFLLSLVFYVVFTLSSAAAMMKLSSIGKRRDGAGRIKALPEGKPLPQPDYPKYLADSKMEF